LLAATRAEALRSAQMDRRRALEIAAAALLAGMASSCAKKKHPVLRAAAPLPAIASTEVGIASWYGHPYHGRAAASGEIYDMEKMTAAHRTLPFGTWVRVTNLTNRKTVEVRITDRGPFIDGRIIDLSHAAAGAIDMVGPGTAQVRVDVIAAQAPAGAVAVSGLFAVQAGAFADRNRAEKMRGMLGRQYGTARIVERAGAPATYRVLVGTESSIEAANLLARKVALETGSGFVVRIDQ
jgi:rare lipoprotein A